MKDSKFIKCYFRLVDKLLPNNEKWGSKFILYVTPILNILGICALCISPFVILNIFVIICMFFGNWCYYDELRQMKL